MTSPTPNPYRLLGVSRQATAAEITAAYRRLLRLHHPDSAPRESRSHDEADRATPADALRRIMAAYEVLHDPVRRAEYDRRTAAPEPVRAPAYRAPAADPWLLRAGPVTWQATPTPAAAGGRRPAAPDDLLQLMDGLLAALDPRRRYR